MTGYSWTFPWKFPESLTVTAFSQGYFYILTQKRSCGWNPQDQSAISQWDEVKLAREWSHLFPFIYIWRNNAPKLLTYKPDRWPDEQESHHPCSCLWKGKPCTPCRINRLGVAHFSCVLESPTSNPLSFSLSKSQLSKGVQEGHLDFDLWEEIKDTVP